MSRQVTPSPVPVVYGTTTGTAAEGNDPRLSDARTPTTHAHDIAGVTGLQGELDGKSDTDHGHTLSAISDAGTAAALDAGVAGGVATLDGTGKVPTGQLPAMASEIADITGLQTALDARMLESAYTAKGDVLAASAASTPAVVGGAAEGLVLSQRAEYPAGARWVKGFGYPARLAATLAGPTYAFTNGDSIELLSSSMETITVTVLTADVVSLAAVTNAELIAIFEAAGSGERYSGRVRTDDSKFEIMVYPREASHDPFHGFKVVEATGGFLTMGFVDGTWVFNSGAQRPYVESAVEPFNFPDGTKVLGLLSDYGSGNTTAFPADATTTAAEVVSHLNSNSFIANIGLDVVEVGGKVRIYRNSGSASSGVGIDGGSTAAAILGFTGVISMGDDGAYEGTVLSAIREKQTLDTDLTAIAALTSAANKVPYATGAGTWAMADFSVAGRALVDDADASTQRATLGLGSAATYNVPASGDAASGEVVKGDDSRLTGGSTSLQDLQLFGDGSDGVVSISSGTTSLTRAMFYSTLTITGTGRLTPAGYPVVCSVECDLSNAPANAIATAASAGSNGAAAGTGGATGGSSSGLPIPSGEGGTAGGAGGATTGSQASNGGASPGSLGGGGGASGAGGNGTSGNGGAGRTNVAVPNTATGARIIRGPLDPWMRSTTALWAGIEGQAGGGGGGDGTAGAGGGGSGSGGWMLGLWAKLLRRGASTAAGAIAANAGNGGDGGTPSAGNRGGGGGAGGGGGGLAYMVVGSLAGASATDMATANGGTGGTGGALSGTGTDGTGGTGGNGGLCILFNIATGTITQTDQRTTAGTGPTGRTGGAGTSCTLSI